MTSLDNYARSKLPLRIAANMEKRLGHPLSEAQKAEVKTLFEQFMAGLMDESAKKLRPLEEFCETVGSRRRSIPQHGLAVLNYLARDTGSLAQDPFKMSDGTELDFGGEMSRVVADPGVLAWSCRITGPRFNRRRRWLC